MNQMEKKILELITKKNPKWRYYGNVKITGHEIDVIYGSVQVSNENWFWFSVGFVLYNNNKPSIRFTMSDWEIKEQYKKFREKAKKQKKENEKKELESSMNKMF